MMTIALLIRTVARQTLQWTALVGATLLLGQIALAEDTVSELMKQRLADMTGNVGTVITVDHAPGAASDPHVHPGSVFAYVLEGAVVSQLKGEKPVTYTKGQSWYESPRKRMSYPRMRARPNRPSSWCFCCHRRMSRSNCR